MNPLRRSTNLEHVLSILNSGRLVALTAPLIVDDVALIGYAVSPEEAYCVKLPLDAFPSLSTSLYCRVSTPRVFHGLKRILECGMRTLCQVEGLPPKSDLMILDQTRSFENANPARKIDRQASTTSSSYRTPERDSISSRASLLSSAPR